MTQRQQLKVNPRLMIQIARYVVSTYPPSNKSQRFYIYIQTFFITSLIFGSCTEERIRECHVTTERFSQESISIGAKRSYISDLATIRQRSLVIPVISPRTEPRRQRNEDGGQEGFLFLDLEPDCGFKYDSVRCRFA